MLPLLKYANYCHAVKRFSMSRFSSPPSRLLSSKTDTDVFVIGDLEKYTPIYRFPRIHIIAAISRLKLFQTGITALAVPASGILAANGYIPVDTYHTCFSICGLALVMLYAISSYTRRTIGFIYMDKNQNCLRVAYLSFWGKRRDVLIPVDDVMPLKDASERADDVYVRLCRYSKADVLFFTLRYGVVLDKDKFERVFGPITR